MDAGLRLMPTLVRLCSSVSETAVVEVLKSCGNPYLQSIVSVQFVTLISKESDVTTKNNASPVLGNLAANERSFKEGWHYFYVVYSWEAYEQVLPSKRQPCCGQRNW